MLMPISPRTPKIVYKNPGAEGKTVTIAVATAGANPEDMHIPTLNPRATDVSLTCGGKVSTSHVKEGPEYSETKQHSANCANKAFTVLPWEIMYTMKGPAIDAVMAPNTMVLTRPT
mmetsp:Transcript_12079/g.19145  ORF Transcript_12079/g.19145 Transcript_12079/m.19145 type:complete len:116 (-) Transcript_12079:564-911(-)